MAPSYDSQDYGMQGKQTCDLALYSLIAGVLGIFFCLVGSIPAIILGHMALGKIKRSRDQLGGQGMAVAGLVLGYSAVAVFVIFSALAVVGVLLTSVSGGGSSEGQLTQIEAPQEKSATSSRELVPSPDGPPKKADAKAAKARAQMDELVNALELYSLDQGSYPTTEHGLAALLEAPEGAKHWKGPYMKEKPIDPWGRPFKYTVNDIGISIWSLGPDGVPSDDDVK